MQINDLISEDWSFANSDSFVSCKRTLGVKPLGFPRRGHRWFRPFFAPWALGASQASSTARNWKRRCRKGLSLGHGWWPWDETHHDWRNFIRCWVGRGRKFGTAKPLSAKHLELGVLTLIYDMYWLVFKASRHMAAIQAFLSINLHDSSRRKRMRSGGMLICPGRLVAGTTPQLCQ